MIELRSDKLVNGLAMLVQDVADVVVVVVAVVVVVVIELIDFDMKSNTEVVVLD